MATRPLIAIPARFSASASALRYRAIVNARSIVEAVYAAGGEPVTILPTELMRPEEVQDRLNWADGVLLPGGGDLSPQTYGEEVASEHVYDVDDVQDEFDMAIANWALARGIPMLAICRGMQVVNVAMGGTLEQHMSNPHRNLRHDVAVEGGTALADLVGASVSASCFHHQQVKTLGSGLNVAARNSEGGIEAVVLPAASGFFVGVQWHPEDTVHEDRSQGRLFEALVKAAR
jgi:putative glutamine amidotransferase